MRQGQEYPERAPFDRFAGQYEALLSRSVRLSGEAAGYFARYKLDRIRALCASPSPAHILDIGCGVGLLTELLGRAFPSARVTGLEFSRRSLEQATRRCAGLANVTLRAYDGEGLPAGIEGVTLVVLANVLHHLEPTRRRTLLERVALPALRPGGEVVVFEHNPYQPVTRLAVRLCPLDHDARLLTLRSTTALLRACRLRVIQRRYIVFFPRPLSVLRQCEHWMGWLPLGAQYMVVGRWRPQGE